MRALAPILEAGGRSLPRYVRTGGYKLASSTTDLEGVKKLEDAVSRVSEPVLSMGIKYRTTYPAAMFRGRPWYELQLDVVRGEEDWRWSPSPTAKSIWIYLGIEGPNTNETFGFMSQVETQMASEISRQEGANWGAPTVAFGAGGTVTGPNPSGQSFWTTGRKWLVGSVTAVATAVAAMLIHDHLSGSASPQPPQSPSTISTTHSAPPTGSTTTAPSGSPLPSGPAR